MDKCIYLSVVPYGYLVSMREKKQLNLHLQEEISFYVKEMSKKRTYLGDYWYDLKYLTTKGLHGVYQLFY